MIWLFVTLAVGIATGFLLFRLHVPGGMLVGAFFMASDYATTPVTMLGQILFGACVGLLTAFRRVFCGATEGISYAIILTNLLTPILEKYTYPRPFGVRKERAKK